MRNIARAHPLTGPSHGHSSLIPVPCRIAILLPPPTTNLRIWMKSIATPPWSTTELRGKHSIQQQKIYIPDPKGDIHAQRGSPICFWSQTTRCVWGRMPLFISFVFSFLFARYCTLLHGILLEGNNGVVLTKTRNNIKFEVKRAHLSAIFLGSRGVFFSGRGRFLETVPFKSSFWCLYSCRNEKYTRYSALAYINCLLSVPVNEYCTGIIFKKWSVNISSAQLGIQSSVSSHRGASTSPASAFQEDLL